MHDAVARAGIMHVVCHDPWHLQRPRELDQAANDFALFGQSMIPAFDGDVAIEEILEDRRRLGGAIDITRREE